MNALALKTLVVNDNKLSLKVSREAEHVARCQRLRYKVYCVERGWYSEVRISKGHEIDAYDNRSNHALLTRLDSGDPIGVVRLVLPANEGAGPDLPIQEIDPSPLGFAEEEIDLDKLAEVSRFAVTREYKNWHPDGPPAKGESRQSSDRRFSLFSVMLMRAIVLMSRQNDIAWICATMEPALILHLARLGIKFKALGEPKEYHGLRQPCYAKLSRIDEEMRQLRPDVHPMVFGD
jgi:N-acyl amino acid synthase of PEP-CTERM/exosortase system